MRISLSALGLAGIAWLLTVPHSSGLHHIALLTFFAAVAVGLWGAITALGDRSLDRGDRIEAVVIGAIPAAIAVFGLIVLAALRNSGIFE